MSYIHIPTKRYPLAPKHIRAENPNVSFPEVFVAPAEYAAVKATVQPAHNPVTQEVRELPPVQLADKTWEQRWEVVAKFKQYTDEAGVVHTVAEQEAAAKAAAEQEIQAAINTATQHRLNTFAATRGYDSILSACTYATSSVAKFAAEGQCANELRTATWAKVHEIFAAAAAGTRSKPTKFEDIEAELPRLEWPAV